MKKSRIILQFSVVLITIIYCVIIISNNIIFFNYPLDTNIVKGKIINYSYNGNQLKIEVKGKNKIIGTIYAKEEKQLKKWKEEIKLGQIIEMNGDLKEIPENTNFHLFNYRKYLYSKKIYYMFDIEDLNIIKSENLFYSIKNKFKQRASKLNSYVSLFIFGDNSLEENQMETYRKNGISHLLAISGMHITLFTTILMKLLKKLKEKTKGVIIIFFLLFYLFLTNFSISVARASILFICLFLKKIFKWHLSTLEVIIYLIASFLLYSPYLIYNIAFIFSFSISFSLILFSEIINKYKNYFMKMFITSLISFSVSLPILINNFFEVNFLSPLINLIFIPFVTFLLFPLALLTFVIPFLNPILIVVSLFFERLSLFISKFSFLTFSFSYLSLPYFIIYYIIIFLFITNLKKTKYWLLIITILFFHYNIQLLSSSLKFTILDVGQGDSMLISFPHNKGNILIDTGGKMTYAKEKWKQMKQYSLSKNTIIPYLKSVGVKKIDYLILTHGDYDHMGESINLVNNFKVKKVIFNCGEFNDLEKELIKVLDKKKIKYYSCIKELNIDNNKLYFLQTKEYDNENDNSNVIYTELDGYKFMFMGDAGVEKEKDILDKYNISDIDVLKVGHHGSKTSSDKKFIDEIKPKYSIISVGKNNRYGHPNKEVLDTLNDSKIYRTDQDGSIMFKFENNKLKIKICKP